MLNFIRGLVAALVVAAGVSAVGSAHAEKAVAESRADWALYGYQNHLVFSAWRAYPASAEKRYRFLHKLWRDSMD